MEKQTPEVRKVTKINDVEYYLDSVTELGKELISGIVRTDKIIEEYQSKAQIAAVARLKLYNDLLVETSKFEHVKSVETPQTIQPDK